MECCRYIERNPVRARIVDSPGQYQWSSFNFYAKGRPDGIITLDPAYVAISMVDAERNTEYAKYVTETRPYEELLDEKISELK